MNRILKFLLCKDFNENSYQQKNLLRLGGFLKIK